MKRLWSLLVLLSALLVACTGVEEVPLTDWVHHTDFPGMSRASATTFVIGTDAYLCCGRTGSAHETLNEVWKYDSQADQWTQQDTFPGKPRVKAVGVTIDGKGYVGMGSTGYPYSNSVFNDFYQYDPQTSKWTRMADFPGSAANDLAYAVVNGRLYTAIGYNGINKSHQTYCYDPQTNTWTRLAGVPHAYSVPAFFALGANFYVCSGFQGRNIRNVMRYNPQKNKWFESADLPSGRTFSNGLEIGGKGYVMLGRYWNGAQNGGRLLSDIVEYDPAENAWVSRGDFPGGARQNAMVFQIQGRGYVVMGENDSERLSDVWSFKP
jgi:N-acetylneuraminic acid mutarotase